jgi:Trk K+ transport system NAD-binding subunit
MDNAIERPALSQWMGELGRTGDVQEIEVTSDRMADRTVQDVGPDLPGGVLIALVARDGRTRVPDAEFVLKEGDRITLIGDRDDVREAMRFCHPDG